jgi:hypothetical protein
MTTQTYIKNIELNTFIYPRFSPYIWDIIGCIGAIITFFNYNNNKIKIYACVLIFYIILNVIFELCSVSFEYSNSSMPNYKEIGIYNFFITNKKYVLQSKNLSNMADLNMADNSRLKIELSIYVGNFIWIKYLLFLIYLFGITKKNYTINDYNDFKDTIIFFV